MFVRHWLSASAESGDEPPAKRIRLPSWLTGFHRHRFEAPVPHDEHAGPVIDTPATQASSEVQPSEQHIQHPQAAPVADASSHAAHSNMMSGLDSRPLSDSLVTQASSGVQPTEQHIEDPQAAPVADASHATQPNVMSGLDSRPQMDRFVVIGEEKVLDMAAVMLEFAAGGQSVPGVSSAVDMPLFSVEFRDVESMGSSDWQFLGAAAVIFIYDTSREDSLESIRRCFAGRWRAGPALAILLVGDTSTEWAQGWRQVHHEDGLALAEKHDLSFLEEPASQRRGAEEVLAAAAEEVCLKRDSSDKKAPSPPPPPPPFLGTALDDASGGGTVPPAQPSVSLAQ
jgi:hypothetical protein